MASVASAALAPISQAGMTVLSIQAGQSVLSASALFRLKCSMLNQRNATSSSSTPSSSSSTSSPSRGIVRSRRQFERKFENTPYSRHQYQPFQWPASANVAPSSVNNSNAAAGSLTASAIADGYGSVQLRHKPRRSDHSSISAAIASEGLFPGLPPLPPLVHSSFDGVDAVPSSLPSLPALDNGVSIKSESSEITPFSPSAGFMDMRDFQLPMSPYSVATGDDGVSVKSEDTSSRFDEIEEVDEDEDIPSHIDDAALAVASVLVRAHEAGYEMDSLTTQIQIALLK